MNNFKINRIMSASLIEQKPSCNGEIAYCPNSQRIYISFNNEWKPLTNTKEIVNTEKKQQLYSFICEKCGAPINSSNKCEYCGTIYK